MASENILTIGFMNIRGQTGLPVVKQIQIEDFTKYNKCDIVHMQEVHISDDSFSSCDFLNSNFNILPNNGPNKYTTASLVKSELTVENVRYDTEGRVIIFDIGELTFRNLYLPSGTDSPSKNLRESYCCNLLPKLLLNSKGSGCIGGDLNCIIDKKDATKHPESKMSNGLSRLVKLGDWQDSFGTLHPNSKSFSRYYENQRAEGATRIDRSYHYGMIKVVEAKYIPLAFSDHFGLVVKLALPDILSKVICPKSRPTFRLTSEVIQDQLFQARLREVMLTYNRVKDFQGSQSFGVLQWWELLVKPGVLKLGLVRSKEINRERREALNLLILRQLYLTRKLRLGESGHLAELKTVHLLIEQWYSKESEKVQHQSRVKEFQESEQTSIYHHELHKKMLKRTAILQLQTEAGMLHGHTACAEYLEKSVEDLLLHPAELDPAAQQALLAE